MKLTTLVLTILIVFTSCKDSKTPATISGVDDQHENNELLAEYPENISKIFDAHGGLDQWHDMQTLKFTMQKENGAEVTSTDLKNRKSLIEMPNHTIGFDGSDVWLHKKEGTEYQGKPKFYYNLMFYFYAMPFVLADDGIIYEDIAPLEFEGKSYPGIKISYESGVGESPEDEYILYYDSDSNYMAWLGYTVTYFTKEKGKEFHFIKYSDWQDVNGLQLPKTLTWYNYENNKPTTKQRDLEFSDVQLSKEKMDASIFEKPEGAEVVN